MKGFSVSLGQATANVRAADLVTQQSVDELVLRAKASPDFQKHQDKYEFRLRQTGQTHVLELKRKNFASSLSIMPGNRRAEERESARVAILRASGREGAVEGDRITRDNARSFQHDLVSNRKTADALSSKALLPGLVSELEAIPTGAKRTAHLKANAELTNLVFCRATDLDANDPAELALKQRIGTLQAEYVSDPSIQAFAQCLKESGFDAQSLDPDASRVVIFADADPAFAVEANTFQAMTEGTAPYLTGIVFSATHPDGTQILPSHGNFMSLANRHSFIKDTIDRANVGPFAGVANLLAGNDQQIPQMLKIGMMSIGHKVSPEEEIDVLQPKISATVTNPEAMDNVATWSNARLTPNHLNALRGQMMASRLGGTDAEFASYLINLSATFSKLSGTAVFGNESRSVIPLRFYGAMLLNAARSVGPHAISNDEYNQFTNRFASNDCADMLADDIFQTAQQANQRQFKAVVPPAFQEWIQDLEVLA